jgi:hypothetical protein
MESDEKLKIFWDYLVFYPDEDEPNFDGVHYGGIKGIMDDAPDNAKKAFSEYQKDVEELLIRGIKL